MNKYDHVIKQWNSIFKQEGVSVPKKCESGNKAFDNALEWLTKDAATVLDFGCGNGIILFWCALYGTRKHIGIDLSGQAIDNAECASRELSSGEFIFVQGSVEKLKRIQDNSIDAIILSNIIDNLYPDDAVYLLEEVRRILKTGGRVLVKLNPHITEEQMKAYNIKVIEGNLLDDGMILLNNTTEQWTALLSKYFSIERYEDLWYPEYEQTNRMYLLVG